MMKELTTRETVLRSEVNIYDVALLSGYSIATVSRVVNRTVRVSAKATRKIYEAIEKLGWKPNELAVNLAHLRKN